MKIANVQIHNLFPYYTSRITTAIAYQKGVFDVRVLTSACKVIVSYDENLINLKSIKETILNVGYEVDRID